jgi:mono/diheme cytochrome c family protein
MRIKPLLVIQLIASLLVLTSLIAFGACSNTTFGQLSEEGRAVYNDYCTLCHGYEGFVGSAPSLDERLGSSFQNAKQIYDKIRFDMPKSAPGMMAPVEYRQVLSYILIKNGFVGQQEIFKVGTLPDITIPKPFS